MQTSAQEIMSSPTGFINISGMSSPAAFAQGESEAGYPGAFPVQATTAISAYEVAEDARSKPSPESPDEAQETVRLQLGAQGAKVEELQQLLVQRGVYSGCCDGQFDQLTQQAVRAFQYQLFLDEDGVVGPLTWQALCTGTPVNLPILHLGSTARPVITVQRALQMTGDYCAAIDGEFSPALASAVQAFQRRSGLVADGTVGPLTWQALSQVPH